MGSQNFASGFATGFGVVDQALSRRRQLTDMERNTSLRERAQGFNEQATNRQISVMENRDGREQFELERQTHADRAQAAEKRSLRITQEILERRKAGEDYDDLLIEFGNADEQLHGALDRFTGFLDGGNQLEVGGTRPDGSEIPPGTPATHEGRNIDDGGEPIEGAREGLLERAAAMNPLLGAHLEEEREQARARAAGREMARFFNSQAGGGTNQEAAMRGESYVVPGTHDPDSVSLNPDEHDNPFRPGYAAKDTIVVKMTDMFNDFPEYKDKIKPPNTTFVPGAKGGTRMAATQMHVPDWFQSRQQIQEAVQTGEMTNAEGQQAIDRMRSWLEQYGGNEAGSAIGVAQRGGRAEPRPLREQKFRADKLNETIGSYLNLQDPDGDAMRRQMQEDPNSVLEWWRFNRSTASTGLRHRMDQEILPVLYQRDDAIRNELLERFPDTENEGVWNPDAPGAKPLINQLRQVHAMEVHMRADYSPARAAEITGESLPVGNDRLRERIQTAHDNRPHSPIGLSYNEVKAAETVLVRYSARAEGRSQSLRPHLTTAAVDAASTLVDAGRITEAQFSSFLETGSFQGFTPMSIAGGIAVVAPDGRTQITMTPLSPAQLEREARSRDGEISATARQVQERLAQGRKEAGENYELAHQQIDRMFSDYPDAERERMKAYFDLQIGIGGGELRQATGIDILAVAGMDNGQVAQLVAEFKKFWETRESHINNWANRDLEGEVPFGGSRATRIAQWGGRLRGGDTQEREREFDEEHSILDFPGSDQGRSFLPNTAKDQWAAFNSQFPPEDMKRMIQGATAELVQKRIRTVEQLEEMTDEQIFMEYKRMIAREGTRSTINQ